MSSGDGGPLLRPRPPMVQIGLNGCEFICTRHILSFGRALDTHDTIAPCRVPFCQIGFLFGKKAPAEFGKVKENAVWREEFAGLNSLAYQVPLAETQTNVQMCPHKASLPYIKTRLLWTVSRHSSSVSSPSTLVSRHIPSLHSRHVYQENFKTSYLFPRPVSRIHH